MYENQAFALEHQIASGDLEPEDVDVRELVYDDETHLTPELEELLTPEQREEFARLQREKLDERARMRDRERSSSRRDAITALRGTPETASVMIGEVEVEVRRHLTGRSEDIMNEFDGESLNVDTAVEAYAVLLSEQIVSPMEYADADVWREVRELEGTTYLDECVGVVMGPVEELEGVVEEFRGDDGGGVDSGGGE